MKLKENETVEEYKVRDKKRGVDYIGVSAVFVCHDGKGNVLMHKRSTNCRDEHGRWDCGGGAMEFGEDLEEHVRREVNEEYLVDPIEIKQVGVSSLRRINEKGQPTHWLAVVYAVLIPTEGVGNGEPTDMEEVSWHHHLSFPEPRHSCFDNVFEFARHIVAGE